MTNAPIATPPGWYPAPDGSTTKWWWDGTRWVQPEQRTSPDPAAIGAIAKLAKATQVLLITYGVVTICTLGIEAFGISAATSFLDGNDSTTDLLGVYDQSTSVVSVLSSLSAIATAVLWVIWQFRVAKQVAGQTRRSAGWHAGSWFIPVVHLWFPYQNISDLWQAVGRPRPAWQIIWWLLWIVGNATVSQSTRIYLAAEDLEQFRAAMWTSAAGSILMLAALPMAWLVIRGITQGLLQRPASVGSPMV